MKLPACHTLNHFDLQHGFRLPLETYGTGGFFSGKSTYPKTLKRSTDTTKKNAFSPNFDSKNLIQKIVYVSKKRVSTFYYSD